MENRAEFIDILKEPELEIGHSKKVLFTSDQFYTWVHGDYPGTKGPLHKHTADQQFYCIQGQCTFHFPEARRGQVFSGNQKKSWLCLPLFCSDSPNIFTSFGARTTQVHRF